MKRRLATLATVALPILLAACGSASGASSGTAKTVNVLAIVDTSGPNKPYGSQELLGVEAAARYYNAHGGILGKQVQVTTVDDDGDPATAAALAVKDIGDNPGKYAMVWAGEEGTTVAALIPIMSRYKVFSTAIDDGDNICAKASACPTTFPQTGSNSIAEAADAQALKAKGYTNVGIIEEQLDFDESELPYIRADLAKLGIKTETASFPSSAVSVTPEMSALQSQGAQAVFSLALGSAAGYVLNGRAALGWNVPVTLDITGSALNLTQLVPVTELKGVDETVQYCMDSAKTIPSLDLLTKYSPQPLNGSVGCSIAGDGWGGMVLLHDAAEKAGSLSSAALATAAESLTEAEGGPGFNFVSYQKYCWTKTDHENVCNSPGDFVVLPAGRLTGLRLYPLSS